MTPEKKLLASDMESLLSKIAETIFNTYNPKELNVTQEKYLQIVSNLNEVEKILQESRS